eukprot:6177025-Pleurochrysis_carterae.AAC.2
MTATRGARAGVGSFWCCYGGLAVVHALCKAFKNHEESLQAIVTQARYKYPCIPTIQHYFQTSLRSVLSMSFAGGANSQRRSA